MPKTYALPQPLTGSEIVRIQQEQNGRLVFCQMPLSQLIALITPAAAPEWWTSLPTTEPATPGLPWNNNGVVSIS